MWKTGNLYLITAIAVIGGGLFGFDIASMSAIISTQPYLCYFNQGPDGPGFNDVTTCSGPKAAVQGGITASMAGGSWLGALISGIISDKLGRKRAIQVGAVIWSVRKLSLPSTLLTKTGVLAQSSSVLLKISACLLSAELSMVYQSE